MIRVEVIANRSIQEDFFEQLRLKNVGQHFTMFSEAQGVGLSGPRQGDHIWPEENFVFVCYTSPEDAGTIRTAVEYLRGKFPNEGIRFFAVQGVDL